MLHRDSAPVWRFKQEFQSNTDKNAPNIPLWAKFVQLLACVVMRGKNPSISLIISLGWTRLVFIWKKKKIDRREEKNTTRIGKYAMNFFLQQNNSPSVYRNSETRELIGTKRTHKKWLQLKSIYFWLWSSFFKCFCACNTVLVWGKRETIKINHLIFWWAQCKIYSSKTQAKARFLFTHNKKIAGNRDKKKRESVLFAFSCLRSVK